MLGCCQLLTLANRARLSAFSFHTDPSSKNSSFHMGTVALSSSIAQAHACGAKKANKAGAGSTKHCVWQNSLGGQQQGSLSAGNRCLMCSLHLVGSQDAMPAGHVARTSSAAFRCGDDTAMITLGSQMPTVPVRCATAIFAIPHLLATCSHSSCSRAQALLHISSHDAAATG